MRFPLWLALPLSSTSPRSRTRVSLGRFCIPCRRPYWSCCAAHWLGQKISWRSGARARCTMSSSAACCPTIAMSKTVLTGGGKMRIETPRQWCRRTELPLPPCPLPSPQRSSSCGRPIPKTAYAPPRSASSVWGSARSPSNPRRVANALLDTSRRATSSR